MLSFGPGRGSARGRARAGGEAGPGGDRPEALGVGLGAAGDQRPAADEAGAERPDEGGAAPREGPPGATGRGLGGGEEAVDRRRRGGERAPPGERLGERLAPQEVARVGALVPGLSPARERLGGRGERRGGGRVRRWRRADARRRLAVGERLEGEARDRDPVARGEGPRADDALAVDVGAVARAGVDDHRLAAARLDPEVATRDPGGREDEVRRRVGSDLDLRRVEGVEARPEAVGGHEEADHRRGRACGSLPTIDGRPRRRQARAHRRGA